MKAYILASGVRISPFGDPAGVLPILDTTLAKYQDSLLRNEGLEPVRISKHHEIEESPCIVMGDNLYITRPLLADFLKSVRTSSATYNFSLTTSPFTDYTTKLQRVRPDVGQDGRDCIRYPLYFLHAADAQINRSIPLSFQASEKLVPIRRSEIISGGKLKISYPITFRGAIAINHWSHILSCSQLALTARLFDTPLGRFAWNRVHPDQTQGPLRRKLRHSLAGRAVKKGRGCDIHPSAVVETSYLGDNVTIGPNAVVIGSYLADGAEVQPAAQVFYCSIGKDAAVGQKSVHNLCVLYSKAFSGASMQYSVVGERAITVYGSFFMDANLTRNFDRHVNVMVGAKQVDSGQMLLGACLGHQTILGTGVWVSSGMEIPNGSFLVRGPDDTLRDFTRAHAGKTVSIQRGKTYLLQGQKRRGERPDRQDRRDQRERQDRRDQRGERQDRRDQRERQDRRDQRERQDRRDQQPAQRKTERDDRSRTGSRDTRKSGAEKLHARRSPGDRRETETIEARPEKPVERRTGRRPQRRRPSSRSAPSTERRERDDRKPATHAAPGRRETPEPAGALQEAEQLDANFAKAEQLQRTSEPEHRKPESRRPESRRPESRRPESRRPESRRPESRRSAMEKPDGRYPESPPVDHEVKAAPEKPARKTPVTEKEPAKEWKPRKFKSDKRISEGKPGFMPGPVNTDNDPESTDRATRDKNGSGEDSSEPKSFGGRKKRIVGRRR